MNFSPPPREQRTLEAYYDRSCSRFFSRCRWPWQSKIQMLVQMIYDGAFDRRTANIHTLIFTVACVKLLWIVYFHDFCSLCKYPKVHCTLKKKERERNFAGQTELTGQPMADEERERERERKGIFWICRTNSLRHRPDPDWWLERRDQELDKKNGTILQRTHFKKWSVVIELLKNNWDIWVRLIGTELWINITSLICLLNTKHYLINNSICNVKLTNKEKAHELTKTW